RLVLGLEPQSNLLVHIRRRSPAHERLDLAGFLRHVFEHPFLRLGGARLHGGPRRFVDAREHGLVLTNPRGVHLPAAFAPLVGAAGFEPATWSTQNSRATRLRYAPPDAAGGRSARLSITRFSAPRQANAGFTSQTTPAGGVGRAPCLATRS